MPLLPRATSLAVLSLLAACSASEAAAPEAATSTPAPVVYTDAVPPPPAPPEDDLPPHAPYTGESTQGGYMLGKMPEGVVSASLADQPVAIADDRAFFAAFDRDSPESLSLTMTFAYGEVVVQEVTVSERQWDIERVNVARTPGGMSEAFWKIREPEYNAIQAARAKETGATGWRQDFIWPVEGRISGRFGRQRIYRGEPGSYHSGLDIAPGNGVPFVAPADGVVVLARTGFSLEGGLIIIDHGAGLNSAFLHASRIVVTEGQSVKQGEHIGNVGSSGRATGPHLHWSLKWNDARLDPLLFLGRQS